MKQQAVQDGGAWGAPEPPWHQAPAVGQSASASTCSTLYIWRLREGSSEEELHQFCTEYCPGFERLKYVPPTDGKWGMGFVKFASGAHANEALQTIRAYSLPSNPGEALQVDFAKADLDEPKRGGAPAYGALVPPPHAPPIGASVRQFSAMAPPAVAASGGGGQRSNPPCDTMFVGSVAPHISEEEVGNALATCAGFERMKMVGEGTERVMVFALFDSVASCTSAIQQLDGNALPSAPYQAIACQYSKNSLGKISRR